MFLWFEFLGMDFDGCIYYVLSYCLVENDSKVFIGWGIGILIWGFVVVGKVIEDDNLFYLIERWSYFGKFKDVKFFIKWLEWRYKKVVEFVKFNGIVMVIYEDVLFDDMLI